jgi:uncharacterized membrane protein YbhN (UPF0104 family)
VTLVFVFFILRTLSQQWSEVRDVIGDLDARAIAGSFMASSVAVWCSYMSWRSLLRDLGHPVPNRSGLRIFFVGQLGKYLPGKFWPVLTQVRLGRAHDIDGRSSAASVLITMLMALGTALLIAAGVIPFLGSETLGGYWWTLLVLPPAAVALWPSVLNRLLDRTLRMLKRDPMPRPLTGRGVALSAAWCMAGWLAYGVHLWILLRDVDGGGGSELLVRSVAAFSASWAIGFLLGITPAGLGPREVSLVVILTPVVGEPVALVAAVVSRLLITASDLAWAGVAVLHDRLRSRRSAPDAVDVR